MGRKTGGAGRVLRPEIRAAERAIPKKAATGAGCPTRQPSAAFFFGGHFSQKNAAGRETSHPVGSMKKVTARDNGQKNGATDKNRGKRRRSDEHFPGNDEEGARFVRVHGGFCDPLSNIS
jgi:hypothetical protein